LAQVFQLALQPLRGEVVHHGRDRPQQADRSGTEEPPRPPKRGLHAQRQSAARFVPDAVFVAGCHVKAVMTWRELAVTGDARVAGLGPSRLVLFQAVLEARSVRGGQTKTGVMNLYA